MQNTEISEARKKAMLKQMPFYEARFVAPADEKAGEMDAKKKNDNPMMENVIAHFKKIKDMFSYS